MKFIELTAGLLLTMSAALGQGDLLPSKGVPPANPDPNPPPLTGKSTISGVVVNSKTHEPIKKATVMINGATSLSAVTDAGGSFSFRALPAGAYWVMANQPDFTARQRRSQMAVNVTVSDGEEKTGLEIALQPGGAVSGTVVNDDEQPVANCSVTANLSSDKPRPVFGSSAGGRTDSEGHFRIHGISPGRYVIRAQCNQSFPAPHGFMRVNDPDIPTEGYMPATYGGGGAGSGGLNVEAGAELNGIDFHLRRSRMFSVRASVTGVDAELLPNAEVLLTAKNGQVDEDVGMPARYNGRRGMFMFRNVPNGTYEVTASLIQGEKAFEAAQDIQVGTSQVSEVELRMSAGPSISGSVVVDDPNVQFEGQQIALQALRQSYRGPTPAAPIEKDGTFQIKSVLPGHFSLSGLPGGFFKSVTLNGREVNPSDFEIGGEAAEVLHVSLSSRFGKIHVGSDTQPLPDQQVSAALIPFDGGFPMVGISLGRGQVDVNFAQVPPGKYRLLLYSYDDPNEFLNSASLQKLLEDRMSTLTVAEASDQRINLPIVGAEEMGKLLNATE